MMALTHGIAGVGLVALASPAVSEYATPPLLLAGFLGGVAPDLDMFAAHRKSLHFPVWYTCLAGALCAGFLLVSSPLLLVGTVAVTAAALHSWSDVLGGSPETAPWNPTTDRAVYNHALGRWHRARRYVRYSGAPEDFCLAFAVGGLAMTTSPTGPIADRLLASLLVVALGYTLARRHLLTVASRLGCVLPSSLLVVLPSVGIEETESGTTTLTVRFRN